MPLTRKAPARFYTSKEVLTELGNVGFMKEKLSLNTIIKHTKCLMIIPSKYSCI
jgi:hypothetical protein